MINFIITNSDQESNCDYYIIFKHFKQQTECK